MCEVSLALCCVPKSAIQPRRTPPSCTRPHHHARCAGRAGLAGSQSTIALGQAAATCNSVYRTVRRCVALQPVLSQQTSDGTVSVLIGSIGPHICSAAETHDWCRVVATKSQVLYMSESVFTQYTMYVCGVRSQSVADDLSVRFEEFIAALYSVYCSTDMDRI